MPRPSDTLNPDNPSVEAVIARHDLRITAVESKLDTIIKLLISAVIAASGACASGIAHILMHAKGL